MLNDSTNNVAHANETFRFAQLSDPHLSSPGIPYPWQLANKRLLGYLSWLRKRRHLYKPWVLDLALQNLRGLQIDHYVVTGDLTHIGLSSEFDQALQWLEQIGEAQDVTVIPGNHDLYVNGRWDRSFAKWKTYLDSDLSYRGKQSEGNNALKRLEQAYPTVRLRNDIAFIGVSSVFAAPWFRATGVVSQPQLDRLKIILQNPELNQFCKVLLIHHPISTRYIASRKRLLNHQQLSQVLRNLPVHLVLHGHGHHSCTETLISNQGMEIPVIGAASSSSVDQSMERKAEFLVFDVSRSHAEWSILARRFNLNLQEKAFTETQSQQFRVSVNY